MKRSHYRVKVPFEIINRGHKFLEDHPGIEVEDYLRALVVLYSTRSPLKLNFESGEEDYFGKEVDFAFNESMDKSLNSILKEKDIASEHFIRGACIQIDKELVLERNNMADFLSLLLKSL